MDKDDRVVDKLNIDINANSFVCVLNFVQFWNSDTYIHTYIFKCIFVHMYVNMKCHLNIWENQMCCSFLHMDFVSRFV